MIKCFMCGNEIEEHEKDNCPYCGKLEIMSPLKLLKYIVLFLALLCLLIGPLVFMDDLVILIICCGVGVILFISFFLIKPKPSKKLMLDVKSIHFQKKFYDLQVVIFIAICTLIVYVISLFI